MSRSFMYSVFAPFALLLAIELMPRQALADSPTCYGQSCNGKDPHDTHCEDDASPVASQSIVDEMTGDVLGRVEMLHSVACDAQWAQVINDTPETSGTVALRSEDSHITYSRYPYKQYYKKIYSNMRHSTSAVLRADGSISCAVDACDTFGYSSVTW